MTNKTLIDHLNEDGDDNKLHIKSLNFGKNALEPVLSEQSVKWHYDVHTKGYIDKYNATQDSFQKGGALLHLLWWEQLQAPTTQKVPDVILKRCRKKSELEFKKEVLKQALSIQGNGWVVINKSGLITTIPNHKYRNLDMLLVLDMWEHAYYNDYGPDKQKYIENFWKIVDWSVVTDRL